MSARILHVSDLHVGARDDATWEAELATLVGELRPGLVVASGDLTHHGLRTEHAEAARRLRGLGVPVLAVPGNHDIPSLPPARVASPWAEFEREWETTEPVFAGDGLHVVGANSVRPWRYQSGRLSDAQLARIEGRLADAGDGALRVVVLHHQLIGAPWRSRKQPVKNRSRVLDRLAAGGAELIVGGHTHQVAVSQHREFDVAGDGRNGAVLSTAPGLERPRPRRRGEAQGAVVYTVEGASLHVDTHLRLAGGWTHTARRTFTCDAGPEPI